MPDPNLFDLFAETDTPEPLPSGSLAKVRHFGDLARQGRLDALTAISKIESEVDAFIAQQRLTNAEVFEPREGRVAKNPRATSAKAAAAIAPRSGTQRARVLIDICEHGGSTDHELEHRLGMLASSVRPRRGELVEAGYVVDSGRVREHQGSTWVIWSPTAAAREWYSGQSRGAA